MWEAARHGLRSLDTAEMDEIAGLIHTSLVRDRADRPDG